MTVLNTFATYEACKPERDRIGFEMAESYPYENDFRIVCEFREKTPSKVPVHRLREELVLLDRSSDDSSTTLRSIAHFATDRRYGIMTAYALLHHHPGVQ
jgi:hypothetical protein